MRTKKNFDVFFGVVMETRDLTSHIRIKHGRERSLSLTDKSIMKRAVLMHVGNEGYVNHILQLSRHLSHKNNLVSLGDLPRY